MAAAISTIAIFSKVSPRSQYCKPTHSTRVYGVIKLSEQLLYSNPFYKALVNGMEFRVENYFIKAFIASTLLALVMMVIALGLIYLFRFGPPLPPSVILVLAAVSFVLSASFFERYEVGSIMWSTLVSLIITFLMTLVSGGVIYFLSVNGLGWEELLSSLAACTIISMALLNYLKRSLGTIEY